MKYLLLILFALTTASAQIETASQLNDRALALSEKREFDEAKKLFGEALAMYQKLGPSHDAHVAVVKMNLAQVYGAEGRRAECAAVLEESLALFRRTLGIENLNTLTAANILGGMYMMLGKQARAAAIFGELLPIERRLYPNDVQLARTLGGMASLHMREGHVQEGLPVAEEALAVTLRTEGEETLDAALAYANLAEAHRLSGEPARALPLFRKSRALYERLLGPDHPRVSSVLTQEGLLQMRDGKLGMAEQSLTHALEMVEKSCPQCVFERVAAENNLALLRIRQGKFAEADRLLTDVLTLQDKTEALPGQEIAVTLQSLAVVRKKERRYDDAERLQRRAALLVGSYR
jgi:tetratricopeptide (TPR) repeat protein